jgi:hypothetical protein
LGRPLGSLGVQKSYRSFCLPRHADFHPPSLERGKCPFAVAVIVRLIVDFFSAFFFLFCHSRLAKPRSLRSEDFNLYVKQSGEFMGRGCLGLRSLQGEKAHQISLLNSTVRDDESFHDMIADPDDELCVVKSFKLLRGHYPTDWPGTILCHQIEKNYARQIKPGPDGFIRTADLSDRGLFGKSYTTEVCHGVATRIKLDCPAGKRHTSASRRRSGITQRVSAPVEVPASEVQQASRHKSAGMSARYQAANEGSHAKRYHAMLVPHPIKKKRRRLTLLWPTSRCRTL